MALSQFLASPLMHPTTGIMAFCFSAYHTFGQGAITPLLQGVQTCLGRPPLAEFGLADMLTKDVEHLARLCASPEAPITDAVIKQAFDWAVSAADGKLQHEVSYLAQLCAVFVALVKMEAKSRTVFAEGLRPTRCSTPWNRYLIHNAQMFCQWLFHCPSFALRSVFMQCVRCGRPLFCLKATDTNLYVF
jgi:hypothetical protein